MITFSNKKIRHFFVIIIPEMNNITFKKNTLNAILGRLNTKKILLRRHTFKLEIYERLE